MQQGLAKRPARPPHRPCFPDPARSSKRPAPRSAQWCNMAQARWLNASYRAPFVSAVALVSNFSVAKPPMPVHGQCGRTTSGGFTWLRTRGTGSHCLINANIRGQSMRRWRGIVAILLAVETALLVPVVYSPYLRTAYIQTLARWFAKAVPPDTVFIGDSITAAGRSFDDYRSINLASDGLQTFQIAAAMPKALAYSPQHISIMAGTNDAGEGPIDPVKLSGLWRKICSEPKVVVTIPPPTNSDILNQRIEQIGAVITTECKERPVIDLQRLAGKNGKILPKYTTDGVHPSDKALLIWKAELRKYGI